MLQVAMAAAGSGHFPLQSVFALWPVRENPRQQLEERRPVMGLGNVTKLMRDDIVNRIHRRFDQPAIEQQP